MEREERDMATVTVTAEWRTTQQVEVSDEVAERLAVEGTPSTLDELGEYVDLDEVTSESAELVDWEVY
jgi:hypothetical protein